MILFLILILAAAIVLYIVVIEGSGPNQRRRSARPAAHTPRRGAINTAETTARWQTIMATSRTGAAGLKSAITEADKLFDHTMKQLGYPGETMAERLKVAGAQLSFRDGVWRAHKLRNTLVHEVGFDLVVSQANEALRDYERGLRDLGAL